MSAPAAKRARPRPGSRATLQFTFENDAASSAFKARFERAKSLLAPAGRPPLDNVAVLTKLLDLAEGQLSQPGDPAEPCGTVAPHLLPSAGNCYMVICLGCSVLT